MKNIGLLLVLFFTSIVYGSDIDEVLATAAENGALKEVQELIGKGAYIKAQNPWDGTTALMMASKKGHLEVVKYLVKEGADINQVSRYERTALIEASENGHLEIVKYLIKIGVDISAKNVNNYTALMLASGSGHIEVVRYLIEKGVDIHNKGEYGTTALEAASTNRHNDIVKLLEAVGVKE